MAFRRALPLLLTIAAWLACPRALAQEPDDGASDAVPSEEVDGDAPQTDEPSGVVDEARARFAAGAIAVEEGRWADAVDDFRRAYELSRAPSALFNVGFALRSLGRYREAAAAFDELLALSDVADEDRTQAVQLRNEVVARIAHVRLHDLAVDTRYGVRLDGEELTDDGARPFVVPADPGRHGIVVSLELHRPFEWAGELGAGDTLDIPVSLAAESQPAAPTPPRPLIEEPWLWIVIIGGAALVGGAIALGVWADDQAQLHCETSACARL